MSDARDRGPARRRLRVATVAGVPVLLAPSWLLIAGAVTLLFGPLAQRSTGVDPAAGYVVAAVLAVALALSVLVHEAAHAVTARLRGLHVEEVVVDLWGGHTSLGRPATPGTSALVSVVGPASNLLLGALAGAAAVAVGRGAPASATAVAAFLLGALALVNVVLGVFNLVPGLPLDGGRVLEALVWRLTGQQDTGTVVAAWAGRAAVVVVVGWVLVRPLLAGSRPGGVDVLWVGLVGFFLWQGASASLRVARFRRRAARVDLAAVSRPAVGVPAGASLADLDAVLRRHGGVGPVQAVLLDERGRPAAVVHGGSVAAVPVEQWSTTPASACAVTLPPDAVVAARSGPTGTVEALARAGTGVVVLDDAGRPAGYVLPDDFAAAMGLS